MESDTHSTVTVRQGEGYTGDGRIRSSIHRRAALFTQRQT